MHLVHPSGYDLAWTLDFLRVRQAPPLEVVEGSQVRRMLRVGRDTVSVAIDMGSSIVVRAEGVRESAPLRAAVSRMLALDVSLEGFDRMARSDRRLAPLVRRHPPLRMPQIPELFEAIVRAVIGQQVSVRGAATILGRLAAAARRDGAAGPCLLDPAEVAMLGVEGLRAIGLTRAKAAAIAGIGERFASGVLTAERLQAMTGDEAQAALDALPGVGPWTASYVRMRALGDMDAFPAADLGVLKALRMLEGNAALDAREATAIAEAWRPWRALAVLHLWTSLD